MTFFWPPNTIVFKISNVTCLVEGRIDSHYAAMGDCKELLLYLLQWKQGKAKEDHDQNKRTPLSWAAEYGALRVVKILLENGAEINSMDDMYSTPLSWLIHAGTGTSRTATEAYLRKSGATERGAKRA